MKKKISKKSVVLTVSLILNVFLLFTTLFMQDQAGLGLGHPDRYYREAYDDLQVDWSTLAGIAIKYGALQCPDLLKELDEAFPGMGSDEESLRKTVSRALAEEPTSAAQE